jgi:hypothetical protein
MYTRMNYNTYSAVLYYPRKIVSIKHLNIGNWKQQGYGKSSAGFSWSKISSAPQSAQSASHAADYRRNLVIPGKVTINDHAEIFNFR